MSDFSWKEAERRFALVLVHPTISPLCRFQYMSHLLAQRRPLEAVEQIGRVVEEDPLSTFYRSQLALCRVRIPRHQGEGPVETAHGGDLPGVLLDRRDERHPADASRLSGAVAAPRDDPVAADAPADEL